MSVRSSIRLSMQGGLGDLVLPDLVVQSAAADPQALGGTLFIPAAFRQHFLHSRQGANPTVN